MRRIFGKEVAQTHRQFAYQALGGLGSPRSGHLEIINGPSSWPIPRSKGKLSNRRAVADQEFSLKAAACIERNSRWSQGTGGTCHARPCRERPAIWRLGEEYPDPRLPFCRHISTGSATYNRSSSHPSPRASSLSPPLFHPSTRAAYPYLYSNTLY